MSDSIPQQESSASDKVIDRLGRHLYSHLMKLYKPVWVIIANYYSFCAAGALPLVDCPDEDALADSAFLSASDRSMPNVI